MEQKKTLWIIASVGVFLLLVLGAAVIVYAPSNSKKIPSVAKVNYAEQSNTSNGWNPNPDNGMRTPDLQPQKTPQVSDMFVVSENTTVYGLNKDTQAQSAEAQGTTIDLNALKKELATDIKNSMAESQNVAPVAPSAGQPNQNISITVNIPDTEKQVTVQSPVMVSSDYYIQATTESVTETKPYTEPAKAGQRAPEQKKPEQKAPAKAEIKQSTTKTATKVTASTTVTKTTAAATTAKPVTRYWVQAAAYTSKKTAEEARAKLSERKISSDIYTYQDNKNKLFYRVRIGPFTTKSEAEYWKAKIVEIPEFAKVGSYVTSTTD